MLIFKGLSPAQYDVENVASACEPLQVLDILDYQLTGRFNYLHLYFSY